MKAVVFTLGCKVNEVESATIMATLEKMGWEVSDKLSQADIYVLNTCAVTKEAEKKSRQLVARVRKYSQTAPIYVCGCASEKDKAQFEEKGVRFVTGARNKEQIIAQVAKDFNGNDYCQTVYPKQVKTRAFIKIEDGCNNFCSYCVIPYLRGRVTSRTVADIVEEVKNTASDEIVLTGINISVFGEDSKSGESLTSLIKALYFTDKRVRLGSLECRVITKDFLLALKGMQNFAPQFHLSLQSGSNAVLKAMNRHYTREEYLEKCSLIYEVFPSAAITTDIIAGFCGETDADFEDSIKIIEEAGFSRVHAFAFSPREGTVAFKMKDVAPDIKSQRLHRLLQAGKEAEDRYINKNLSTVQQIIFEDFNGTYTEGYTASYIKVYVLGNHTGKANVQLIKAYNDGVIAEII